MRLLSAQNDKSSRVYAYHHGHGEGAAATWPTKKRVKTKATTAEGEKNMVAGRRMDKRVGGWGFWRGGDNRCELGRTCGRRRDKKMKESGRGNVRNRQEEGGADSREVGGKREDGRPTADGRLLLYAAGLVAPRWTRSGSSQRLLII